MAYYIEEEAWKCPKHPSKKRRITTGVCSICLIDRLSQLCPYCANVRPCSLNCAAAAVGGGETVLSRSKSVGIPFLKLRNISSGGRRKMTETSLASYSGKVDRGGEPEFCRSKTVGIPFLKSKNVNSGDRRNQLESEKSNRTTSPSSSSGGKVIDEPAFCSSKSVGIQFLKSENVNFGDRRNMPESENTNKTTDSCSSRKINSKQAICSSKSAEIQLKTTSSSSSSSKIISEQELCRSKSVGIPFLKSRNVNSVDRRTTPEIEKGIKTASFWWIFKSRKSNKTAICSDTRIMAMTVMRSRSVNVEMTSVSGGNDVTSSPEKWKGGWYLVSPMKVFRHSSKASKLVS
ncbi:hypothetical protein FXO37_13135 [Capsicum annuum]|nr:hypothetical protein FXO37_13135 [Capsicum annuum]